MHTIIVLAIGFGLLAVRLAGYLHGGVYAIATAALVFYRSGSSAQESTCIWSKAGRLLGAERRPMFLLVFGSAGRAAALCGGCFAEAPRPHAPQFRASNATDTLDSCPFNRITSFSSSAMCLSALFKHVRHIRRLPSAAEYASDSWHPPLSPGTASRAHRVTFVWQHQLREQCGIIFEPRAPRPRSSRLTVRVVDQDKWPWVLARFAERDDCRLPRTSAKPIVLSSRTCRNPGGPPRCWM